MGVQKPANPNVRFATLWFTFLYIPIIPLWRGAYRLDKTLIEKNQLQLREVLTTYLFSYLLVPFLLFTPMGLAVVEVQEAIGISKDLQVPLMILSVLWVIGGGWKLADWDEARWAKEAL